VYEDDYFSMIQLLLYSLKYERDFNTIIEKYPNESKKGDNTEDISVSVRTSTIGFEVGVM
jgi:hypothetical protein